MYKFFKKFALQFFGYIEIGQKVNVLGFFTVVNRNNVRVGRNFSINHDVFILGRNEVLIGDNVILSARCMLLDAGFDVTQYLHSNVPVYEYKNSYIHIEDNVWIGAGAIVLPGVTIGRNSIVAAGSVVTKDVPSCVVVAGNPAKIIRIMN